MLDYIVRLLVLAVEGGAKVSLHPVVGKKYTKMIGHMPWLYQESPVPFHRSHKNCSKCEKLPPLDDGGPEMKFTYFHCFS